MFYHGTDKATARNLADAGCDEQMIQKFFSLRSNGCRNEQYRLLYAQRACLVERMHDFQRKIDCLDYLIYKMKQNDKTKD